MVFTIFTANCSDYFIADEEIRSFSIKNYSFDVNCWWNIKSHSADEIIWVRTVGTKNVEVTLESPVCFSFTVRVIFLSYLQHLMLNTDKVAKRIKIIKIRLFGKFNNQLSFFSGCGKYKSKITASKTIILPTRKVMFLFTFILELRHIAKKIRSLVNLPERRVSSRLQIF